MISSDEIEKIELVEIKDGVLTDPDARVLKVRNSGLLPIELLNVYVNRSPVINQTRKTHSTLVMSANYISAQFNNVFMDYVEKHENTKLFLTNTGLIRNGTKCHQLIAIYNHGIIIVAPEV